MGQRLAAVVFAAETAGRVVVKMVELVEVSTWRMGSLIGVSLETLLEGMQEMRVHSCLLDSPSWITGKDWLSAGQLACFQVVVVAVVAVVVAGNLLGYLVELTRDFLVGKKVVVYSHQNLLL